MKKGDKRKQKKTEQKRSGRKTSISQVFASAMAASNPIYYIRHAREYPIQDCWVNEGWQKSGLATVVIARQQPNRNIVFGCYLVDVFCLGVKNVIYNADIPASRFRLEFYPQLIQGGRPLKISAALAHEIVYGAIEYAAQFEFHPHRDFREGQHILDLPTAHPRSGLEFGKDGKPFYISGPYDNVDAIMRKLTRFAGKDQYHYLMQLGEMPDDLDETDWDEAEDEDDE